ncbi:hypothetical protein F5Y06DRAFT_95178 [Hypoxylon sp. FL0890]|nr:hypothetical protein F5Y06DRAFT_95178 [Hypoxylon sp. FL0890]
MEVRHDSFTAELLAQLSMLVLRSVMILARGFLHVICYQEVQRLGLWIVLLACGLLQTIAVTDILRGGSSAPLIVLLVRALGVGVGVHVTSGRRIWRSAIGVLQRYCPSLA